MTRTRTGIFAILATVVLLGPLSAQQPPSLARGQRVRVTAPSARLDRIVGTVLGVRGREFVLEVQRFRPQRGPFDSTYTATYSVSLDSLRSLEVSRGRHRHFWAGAGIGAVVGGVVGGIAGGATGGGFACTRGCAAGIGATSGVVLGGLLGGAIGAAIVTERWANVPLSSDRIGLVVTPARSLGLGASLAF
jgi:hypothetical protein